MLTHPAPLTRKLTRDLWRIRGQALAIAAVIAVGVMLLVMMTGLTASLSETRRAYYDRYRLAEVFAPVTRAPDRLAADLRALPGVSRVETRVTGRALIDLPGQTLPVQARALSLPDFHSPALNAIYLTDGRLFDGSRADEVVVLKSFAKARGLHPGDRLTVTMNGFRRVLRVVGFAQSPEFLYATAPGELVPDDARFAVLWMSRTALSAAYDMEGAFSEALISLSRGTDPQAVIAGADRLLDRFGATGAYALKDLESNRFITEEIDGLKRSAASVPPVILAVAAFLMYMVISRMIQAEREQIGLMKAFGYRNREVGSHYFRMILTIALGGALMGSLFGILLGRSMIDVYLIYYKFPFLVFRLEPSSFLIGFGASLLAASAGGLVVLRRVFALTPAVAMRAPAPPDYSRSGRVAARLSRLLDQPSRMVLRRITRQPLRIGGAVLGVASGLSLSVAMIAIIASFDAMQETTFSVIDRSDLNVSFTRAIAARSAFDLARIPGVIEVEPVRIVPAILKHGRDRYNGAIYGLVATPRLNRAVDAQGQPIPIRDGGVVLSTGLARTLKIGAGDHLQVEVREGRRPSLSLPVVAVADSLLGSPAYMALDGLNRALKEPLRVSGAYLRVDAARTAEIYRALKAMPMVAGVSVKSQSVAALERMMDEGAGAMRYVMALIAGVVTFGVIYNAARIAQAERARDLASLRVLGFSRNEVAFVLLGELVAVMLLALPLGALMGYGLTFVIAAAFSTDIYQIRPVVSPASYGWAMSVVIAAALISGLLVKRDIDRADVLSALKTRE
ncbi:ABC transporter permease [Pseudodonghicola flavimaris]|uniref:ABC transporter permease n=1 Tax=Pseudodonghicola flavimaris TaxID=3050036 RepID=A0ABT7F3K4_9RHOB|nr:ABC transporter permease [Pseudodonghicola flavimaris]MDK3019186.1 ABC transporter permease [Pseudodonghicola flavimaris]